MCVCVCVCFSQFTLVYELSTCWSEILRMVSWELRVFRNVGLHIHAEGVVCQCVSVRTCACVCVCLCVCAPPPWHPAVC